MTSETKQCQNCHNDFIIEPDDFAFYEKMGVPAPKLCPECRMCRKLIWRNERTLYKRICDSCGSSIITIFHPRYPAPVYCSQCYYSDKWDGRTYVQPYDPNRPFFEQFGKLLARVPKCALYIGTTLGPNVNSEYVNFAGGCKNCYLIFNSAENEDCSYSRGLAKCRGTIDTYFAENTERCYECVNVVRSNGVRWGQNISNSLDSWFVLNCAGIEHCFGCVNLRHKSYYFFNEPLLKEEWIKKVSEVFGSYNKMEEARQRFEKFSLKYPRREHYNFKSVNCIGDYLTECKDCYNCFEAYASENCRYGFSIKIAKDSYDVVGRGVKCELLLEAVAVGSSSRVIGSWWVEASRDVYYSFDIRQSEECFGCAGLKNTRYCILNKQYNEEEYQKIKKGISEELQQKNALGLFLPPEISPWAYNETLVEENFPLTKEQASSLDFRWEDDIPRTKGRETLLPDKIPDYIDEVPDSIMNEVLRCIECGFNYRLISSEIDFYRSMRLPTPKKCFDCRHRDRLRRRGPFKLHVRNCAKCQKSIQTTYAPDRPEIVYCEQCYIAEVV